MNLKHRLEHAERWLGSRSELSPLSATAAEVRTIDQEIARLELEIAEVRTTMTPAELARERLWHKELDARLAGLSLDEHIEALKAEIAALEAQEGEGGIVNASM